MTLKNIQPGQLIRIPGADFASMGIYENEKVGTEWIQRPPHPSQPLHVAARNRRNIVVLEWAPYDGGKCRERSIVRYAALRITRLNENTPVEGVA